MTRRTVSDDPQSRRQMLRRTLTGGVAAASAVLGTKAIMAPDPAAAANGGAVKLGISNAATAPTTITNGTVGGKAIVGRAGSATSSEESAGVTGISQAPNGSGVYGVGDYGVYGRGFVNGGGASYGVYGTGPYGVVAAATIVGVTGSGLDGVKGTSPVSGGRGVVGSGDYGVYGSGDYNDASYGVYGKGPYGVVGAGTKNGVTGAATDPGSVGVHGAGRRYGVRGIASNPDYAAPATGVLGRGYGVGVEGVGSNPNSAVATTGVLGRAGVGVEGVGESIGVRGTGMRAIEGTSTTANAFYPSIGVYAYARHYGVHATASAANGLAGQFNGDVQVSGEITQSAASTRIDHPADPANRYLQHAAVQSPDMLNVYSGSVVLGSGGRATVRLPRYFEALNSDARVQLTAIGASAPGLHVARKVEGGSFAIAGGARGQEVFWQVTGVRQDTWARNHRTRVDYAKPARERGRYLDPELFGKPRSKAIGWLEPSIRVPEAHHRPDEHG